MIRYDKIIQDSRMLRCFCAFTCWYWDVHVKHCAPIFSTKNLPFGPQKSLIPWPELNVSQISVAAFDKFDIKDSNCSASHWHMAPAHWNTPRSHQNSRCLSLPRSWLSWYYPDIILISSWYYPDIILVLSWYHPDIILILSWYYPDIILISSILLSWYYPDIILIPDLTSRRPRPVGSMLVAGTLWLKAIVSLAQWNTTATLVGFSRRKFPCTAWQSKVKPSTWKKIKKCLQSTYVI